MINIKLIILKRIYHLTINKLYFFEFKNQILDALKKLVLTFLVHPPVTYPVFSG